MLSQELMVTKDCLVSTQLALQDLEHSFRAAKTLVDDSSISLPSVHTQDTDAMLGGGVDTLVSVADSSASGVLSTSIFFGTLEANIGQLNQKEMIPSRTCTLGFSIDLAPSQEIDSINDKGKTVDGIHGDVVAQPTHPIMHSKPSFEDGNIGWNTLDHLGIQLA